MGTTSDLAWDGDGGQRLLGCVDPRAPGPDTRNWGNVTGVRTESQGRRFTVSGVVRDVPGVSVCLHPRLTDNPTFTVWTDSLHLFHETQGPPRGGRSGVPPP